NALNRIYLFLYDIDGVAETFIFPDLRLYLLDAVVDSGVVLSSQDDPHYLQGCCCHITAEIHEYLAGNGNLRRPLAALEVRNADAEVLRDYVQYKLRCHLSVCLGGDDILQRLRGKG